MSDKKVLRRKSDNTYWIGRKLDHPFDDVYFVTRLKCLSSESDTLGVVLLAYEVEEVSKSELTALLYGD